jgi:copper chaperone CopZ
MTDKNKENKLKDKIEKLERKVELLESKEKGILIKKKTLYLLSLISIFFFVGIVMGSYLYSLKNNNLTENEKSDVPTVPTSTSLKITTTTSLRRITTTVVEGSKAKVYLKIGGMTCGGCSYRIKRTLEGMEGIFSVEISLSSASGVVEYDPEKISQETIAETITNLGYPARIISSEEEVEKIASIPAPQPTGGRRSGGGCGCGCGG